MTENELKEKLNLLEKNYENAKKELYYQYAMKQVIFSIGDIISDKTQTIIIDKITAYKGFGLPQPVYHGIELTRNLTPRKDKRRGSIYGNSGAELLKKQ